MSVAAVLDGAGYSHMELCVIVLALWLLGLLAARFGYDSTPGLRSHEEEAAAAGMTWDALELR